MALKQVLDLYEAMDSAFVTGQTIADMISGCGVEDCAVKTIQGHKGQTDFIKIKIPGSQGKTAGGPAPTLGVVGRLGGLGARPERIGFVSDGDGALAAAATAMKLGRMAQRKL